MAHQVFTPKNSCWIKSCEVRESDCKSPSQGKRIELDGHSVFATQNEIQGWNEEICLSCKNSKDEILTKVMKVEQQKKPERRRRLNTKQPVCTHLPQYDADHAIKGGCQGQTDKEKCLGMVKCRLNSFLLFQNGQRMKDSQIIG